MNCYSWQKPNPNRDKKTDQGIIAIIRTSKGTKKLSRRIEVIDSLAFLPLPSRKDDDPNCQTMYGGLSSKLGRSAAHNKRPHSSFPPPPRPSGPGGGPGRLSLGGGSARKPAAATASKTPPAVEETFNLVAGSDALAFSMIIRLAPDLVDEIRRVEAQGGRARMKFDPNPHNPNGNIIDVGGKEFRFTWSREFGDLCDIYEERQSGEDGNGLFVESGSAWRKLNVQRILDESTKNHLKMRSVEADKKSKQRKAIVLEPGNPSLKCQIKQLAAVEGFDPALGWWRTYDEGVEDPLCWY
ncbi:hypothetical protein Ahy_A09g046317 isoform E [Arachis hypogaea]|uniref:Uncharacterized protein n=1 Tax=Arachis hypogaea TaxID=3818 RepID=A0A445BPK0_ARAHY|nr:hypothetical protein Ahy_A09g046317 isoform E [Arachis hypogaea]